MKQVLRALPVLCLLALLMGAAAPAGQEGTPPPGAWRTFVGTWGASGHRQVLPSGEDRPAATVQLSGSLALETVEGLARGFRLDVIGFDDGGSISVGRAVWTDERGNRIYSRLTGESIEAGRRVVGTFTGGTGRYASLEGDYVFTWQYVITAEGDLIQGRSTAFSGRFRFKVAGR
jgi:hypothetical protein